MLVRSRKPALLLFAVLSVAVVHAADFDRDFNGKWLLNVDHSELRNMRGDVYPVLMVEQAKDIRCIATAANGTTVQWTYRLDGEDSKYQANGEKMNSAIKWEGAALLINTLVSGARDYTIADRWTLSRDRTQLNIQRQITGGPREVEGYLIYRREGTAATDTATAEPATSTNPTTLVRRPDPPSIPKQAEYTINAGTRILLTLTNPVSTKNTKDGEHVYLQTAMPVAIDGKIVIPRGSYVQGSVIKSKEAGRGSQKGELLLRFDTLTLPNGVVRDFRARVSSADTNKGKVDQEEGKISGNGKDANAGKVARDVGIGTGAGAAIGHVAGHTAAGAAAGAAAGLAAILLSKNQDIVLPRGTSVEMLLDRDLSYTAAELRQ